MSSVKNVVLICCLILLSWNAECKKEIKIGGIFLETNRDAEIAFRNTIDRVNMHNRRVELTPVVHFIGEDDSFKAGKIACNLTAEGVAAIFGPPSIPCRGIVESTCQAREVPHLQTAWQPASPPPTHPRMAVNLYPDQQVLSKAFAALVQDYDWKGYTILYEDDLGLVRLQEVLKKHGPSDPPITLRQLEVGGDNRPLLKEIKASGEAHIILDCEADRIVEYLRQANEVNLMGDYQSYVLTSLDAHTIDFAELQYSRSNITGFRMIDPTNYELKIAVNDWEQGEMRNGRPVDIRPETVKLETALMSDAVNHFGLAFSELEESQGIETKSLPCDRQDLWEHGLGLMQFMKIKPSNGLSGSIRFDADGRRADFSLDIIEFSKGSFKKIGIWDSSSGINYTRSEGDVINILSEKWQNKTFIVTSRLGPPFLMERHAADGEILTGNRRYEGYSMDLIDGIAKILHFDYIFTLAPDKNYGNYNKDTKQWNGLIKELLDGKADLAICDLTITYDRRTAVDFTMPFMTLGISILFSKPTKQPPDLFSFLQPLSLDVWIYMATAYLGVSILLFVLARMSPAEWQNPHPCNSDSPELENSLTFINCLWIGMGSFLQQGSDIMPRAVSTRMVAGMWWFFTLIMISSYTANLAAFLTKEGMDATIDSAEDLAKQTKIKYGAVTGGSTLGFFKDSNFSTYQRMYTAMESAKPSVFVSNNDEGKDRVIKGKRLYAFIMESTSIEYIVERNCDLQQVGGKLDSKGYGIAMPVNSPYRTAISGAVLKMQEEGKLHALKTKWWKEMYVSNKCPDDTSASDASAGELGIANVGGVFVVLGAGVAIAFIIAIMEFLWNVKQVAVDEKLSLKEAFMAEIKFAVNIWQTTKPVHNTPSESSHSSARSGSQRREPSEARSRAGEVLHAASSFMRLDKIF